MASCALWNEGNIGKIQFYSAMILTLFLHIFTVRWILLSTITGIVSLMHNNFSFNGFKADGEELKVISFALIILALSSMHIDITIMNLKFASWINSQDKLSQWLNSVTDW